MKLSQKLIEQITNQVGFFDTDVLLGWEAGLKGKCRIGNKLFERHPPEHFSGRRLVNWLAGHEGATKYKASKDRCTYFCGQSPEGEILVIRKGWVYSRGKVITQMEKSGASGEVRVLYFEDSKIIKKISCGI